MEEEFRKKISNKLVSFEKKSKEWEWSDLIRWLTGLKHIITSFQLKIPEELVIPLSKRLTQCLHPSLPHGLHSKTLEIYELILKNSFTKQIFIFSTGLFQHFQYCSAQNKLQFLSIISEVYINKPNLELLTSGLIACLLSGAGDKQDILSKITEIIESIQDKQKLHIYLWSFTLKSKKFKNIGLVFMQKRLQSIKNENLIINTLLESLEDKAVVNRRYSLDIIKSYYPITENNSKIVMLMQGSLKLLRGKDHSLIRRLWEWTFPDEIHKEQVLLVTKIIKQALSLIFHDDYQKMMEKKQDSEEIMNSSIKIIEEIIESEGITEDFIKETAVELVLHLQSFQTNLLSPCGPKASHLLKTFSKSIYQSIFEYIDENLLEKEKEITKILFFVLINGIHSENFCRKVIIKIATVLHKLKNFSEFIKILKILLENIKIFPSIKLKHSNKIIQTLISNKQEEVLINYIFIINKLITDPKKIFEIISCIKLSSNKNLMLTVKALLKFPENVLKEDDFQVLWRKVSYHNTELLKILVNSYTKWPNQWSLGLASLLFSMTRDFHIRSFIIFWDYASSYHSEILKEMSRTGKIIFIMIDNLTDNSPSVRHAGIEWLNLAIKSVECLIDPILSILLHTTTLRKVNEKGHWEYLSDIDTSRVLDALKKISTLLLYGHSLLSTMQSSHLSLFATDLVSLHNIDSKNYLDLCIQISLYYIKTNNSRQNFEINKIQASAAEVLRLLLKKIPNKLMSQVIDWISEVTYRVLGTKLEFSMVAVYHQLFQEFVSFVYPSKTADVLVLGLRNDDYYTRAQWGKVTSLALASILSPSLQDPPCNFLNLLLINYCDVIQKYKDFALFSELNCLIYLCVNLKEKIKPNKFKLVKALILSELERITTLAIKFNYSSEITSILALISENFPNDTVIALIEIWIKHFNSETLYKQQKIVSKLGLSSEQILDGIISALQSQKYNETIMGNLIHTIINKNFLKITEETTLNKMINICKLLDNGKWDEVLAWILSILHISLLNQNYSSKTLGRIRNIVEAIIYKFDQGIIKWEKIAISVYAKLPGKTILEGIFFTLIESQAIFRILWKSRQSKMISIVADLAKKTLENIFFVENSGEVLSKLLSTLIINFPLIFDSIRSSLIDIIKNQIFVIIHKFPDSLVYWYDIINNIPKHSVFQTLDVYDVLFWKSFDYKSEMLAKSIALISLIIISGTKDAHISSLSFISKRIDELLAFPKVSEKHFSLLCILLRVMSIKFSDFSEIWIKIWPDLYTGIIKYLSSITLPTTYDVLKFIDTMIITYPNFSNQIWMYLYDIAEIELLPGNCYGEYIPVASKFIKGFSARPCRIKRKETLLGTMKRQILLTENQAETVEDIEKYAKILISYTMLYSTEIFEIDWESIETSLKKEIINIQSLIN